MEQALKDNDPIRAVITGSGINQDGRTPGITMPNGSAQGNMQSLCHQGLAYNLQKLSYVPYTKMVAWILQTQDMSKPTVREPVWAIPLKWARSVPSSEKDGISVSLCLLAQSSPTLVIWRLQLASLV